MVKIMWGLLVALSFSPGAWSQKLQYSRVSVSAGPLLFFNRSKEGEELLSVLDPAVGGEAQVIAQGRGWIEAADRIDRKRIVVRGNFGHPGLAIVDLGTGKSRDLVAGMGVYSSFFGISKGRALFSVRDGRNQLLCQCPVAAGGESEQLFDRPVERVVGDLPDGLLVVTAGPKRELWKLSAAGKGHHRLCGIPDEWELRMATFELSQDHRRVAIGAVERGVGLGRSLLRVVDLLSGKTLREERNIDISVSPLSSQMPRLRITWLGPDRLRFSETVRETKARAAAGRFRYVDLDVTTGERLGQTPYSQMSLAHTQPPRGPIDGKGQPLEVDSPGSWSTGFSWPDGKLQWRGDVEGLGRWVPVSAQLRYRARLAPGGRWLAFGNWDGIGSAVILDGKKGSVRVISHERCTNLRWLPAVSH